MGAGASRVVLLDISLELSVCQACTGGPVGLVPSRPIVGWRESAAPPRAKAVFRHRGRDTRWTGGTALEGVAGVVMPTLLKGKPQLQRYQCRCNCQPHPSLALAPSGQCQLAPVPGVPNLSCQTPLVASLAQTRS